MLFATSNALTRNPAEKPAAKTKPALPAVKIPAQQQLAAHMKPVQQADPVTKRPALLLPVVVIPNALPPKQVQKHPAEKWPDAATENKSC